MKRTHVKRSLGGGFLLLVGLVALSLQATPDATQPIDPAVDRIHAGKIPLGIEFRVPPGAQLGPLGIEFQLPNAMAYLRPLGFEYQLPSTDATSTIRSSGDVVGIEFEPVEDPLVMASGDGIEFEAEPAQVPTSGDVLGVEFERVAEVDTKPEQAMPALGDLLGIEYEQLAEARPGEFHVAWVVSGSQGENPQAPPCPPVCE